MFTGMVDEKNFRRLRQLLSWLNKVTAGFRVVGSVWLSCCGIQGDAGLLCLHLIC